MSLILLKDVKKEFRRGKRIIRPLDGVNLDLAPGGFLVVEGASGCGKTTLLNLVGGLSRPTSGAVSVDGKDIGRMPEHHLSAWRGDFVGFIFQQFHLLPGYTALGNVELPMVPRGISAGERSARAEETLGEAGLPRDTWDAPVRELSGGEQQRVAAARALVNDPALILADEPVASLDRRSAGIIYELLSSLHERGKTIILALHDSSSLPDRFDARVLSLGEFGVGSA